MKAFYDAKPSKIEAQGNGSYAYRYDIKEEEKPAQNGSEEATEGGKTQWSCEEVIVWSPLSSNKITEKVVTEKWDRNYEQKLVNEFNAAQLGILSEEEAQQRTEAYRQFLKERTALKSQVDADCEEFGIK